MSATTSALTVIVGGTIIDGTGAAPVPDGVVLVEDDRIAAVGPAARVPVPGDARVISASGQFVLPGFVDCHNHLGFESGRDESHQAADPPFKHFARAVKNARTQLRDGVTTLRELGEIGFLDVDLRDAFAAGDLPGPRLLASGPWLTTSHGHGSFPGVSCADGVDRVRQSVRQNAKAGVDVIKIMVSGGVSTAGSDVRRCYYSGAEIEAAIEEAHNAGLPVAAHLHGGPGLPLAVVAGMDTIEHGFYLTESDLELMVQHGSALVMAPLSGVFRPPNPLSPPFQIEKMQAARESAIRVFQTACRLGVRVGCGADTSHRDHALALEAESMVRCGAAPAEVVQILTRSGAEICGLGAQTGTLQTGKLADVVILGADPLADIRALRDVQLVMKAGRVCELSPE